jgi:chaperone modulatory protein CbpM
MTDDVLIPADAESPVDLAELLAASGLAEAEVLELVEFGVLETKGSVSGWSFHARVVHQARRAATLRDTFGLRLPPWQAGVDRMRNAPAAEPSVQYPQAAPGGQAAPPRRRNPLGDLLNELGR